MPPKIPSLSSKKFLRLLERNGAHFVRQRGTSHAIYERQAGGKMWRAPVLTGKKQLSPWYIRLVFQQLGFSDEEIKALFK
ncbi:MAG: type II toxin-antitoxin system HicA family toxin [Anaerolineae bacterium]